MAGKLVISLDMELMWGVRDQASKERYGHRVLGERRAIPAMLDLFEKNGIHASWAVVGMAMCDGIDELLERAPSQRPSYSEPQRSTYHYLSEVGASERADPYYFAPSMIRQIMRCPAQEICTHTFSHYYCLEPGQRSDEFAADVRAARRQLDDWGIDCKTIVFPRNQYGSEHLRICAAEGLRVYRGNERSWFYRAASGSEDHRVRRLGRLVDTYVPLTGANVSTPTAGDGMVNVPSSRLLRAYNSKLSRLDNLRLKRVRNSMSRAARENAVFHLWWHPHNFGADTHENIAFLSKVLGHFRDLRDTHGMESATMAEAAAAA